MSLAVSSFMHASARMGTASTSLAPPAPIVHGTHSWLGGFAARLLQLRPHVSLQSAIQCAVVNFHHAADMAPQAAAELFVQANPIVGGSAPSRPAEPQAARYRTMFGHCFGSPAVNAWRLERSAPQAIARQ